MEAGQDARQVHVLDCVAKAAYSASVPVTPLSREKATLSVPKNAGSASPLPVLWKACAEGYSGKFGVVRSGSPGGIGLSVWVAVRVCPWDRPVGTPEPIVVLGLEAGDHGVAPGDMRHRQHPRRLHEVESVVCRRGAACRHSIA